MEDNNKEIAITEETKKSIETLEELNTSLSIASEKDKDIKILSPIDKVESSLSKFVEDSFAVTKDDFQFKKNLQEEISKRLPSMKNNEVIALYTNDSINGNDRLSKVLGPMSQLLTAKQQAEMAKNQNEAKSGSVNVNIGTEAVKRANLDAPKDVLQGLTDLNRLLGALAEQKIKNS